MTPPPLIPTDLDAAYPASARGPAGMGRPITCLTIRVGRIVGAAVTAVLLTTTAAPALGRHGGGTHPGTWHGLRDRHGRSAIVPPTRAPTGRPAPTAVGRRVGAADSVVVEKALRRLTLYAGGHLARTYAVALGRRPEGPKERAGDFRTPEGLYVIDARNPVSRYHRGLHVSYPNAADRARARALGVPAGGDVMIHGLPNGRGAIGARHREFDWTHGCIAVTDAEIDELWAAVPVGTPVRIIP